MLLPFILSYMLFVRASETLTAPEDVWRKRLADSNSRRKLMLDFISKEKPTKHWSLFGFSRSSEAAHDDLEPWLPCSTLERVPYSIGDGPKWVCGADTLGSGGQCVVFSVGSNAEFSFELGLKNKKAMCDIHTFDPTLDRKQKMLARQAERQGLLTFHEVGLGGSSRTKPFLIEPLRNLLEKVGAKKLDLLKMDIEGFEYETLHTALHDCDAQNPLFEQLLVELHGTDRERINTLARTLVLCGYHLVSKERNTWGCGGVRCVEYTFVHESFAKREFLSLVTLLL